jgi:hypothetical protein
MELLGQSDLKPSLTLHRQPHRITQTVRAWTTELIKQPREGQRPESLMLHLWQPDTLAWLQQVAACGNTNRDTISKQIHRKLAIRHVL